MNRADDWDDEERAALENVREELGAIRDRHRDDPPIELLRASRADALPEALNEEVSNHLERSAWSRTLVEGADSVDPALDSAAQARMLARIHADIGTAPRGRRWFQSWLLASAVAMAVIVLAVVIFRRPQAPNQTASVAVAPQPAAQVPTLPPSVPPAPGFILPLDKPDVKFTALALVLRGSADGPKFIDAVAPGIRAYRSGDYATAERELAALQPQYPNSVEVPFYLGVSRLFLGDAAGARSALDAARRVSDDSFAPAIDWFLAVADERAGRLSDAGAALQRVCGATGEYREKACDAATRIASR
ncbi:MAG TPA: hypothetical protein VGH34_08165 [Vicinamibacterales bacterium]|jgi:hypothetical protein